MSARLGSAQREVLEHIDQVVASGVTGTIIGRAFWRTDPEATIRRAMIESLLNKGLIEIVPVEHDSWHKGFRLTAEGEKVVGRVDDEAGRRDA